LNNEQQNLFRVALDLPLKQTFTYSVPKGLNGLVKPGHRVLVSFRNRRATGYVLQKEVVEPKGEIKEIIEILDQEPLFPPGLIPFFKWLADYYLYPLGRLIQSALPGGLNERSYPVGLITSNGLEALKTGRITSQERFCLEWVKEHQGKRLPPPLETAYRCQKKGWIHIKSRTTKRKTGPLKKKYVQALDLQRLETILKDQPDSLGAKNEIRFLQIIYNNGKKPLSEISSLFTNGHYLVKKWVQRGLLEINNETVLRTPTGRLVLPVPEPHRLSNQQKKALETISALIKKQKFRTSLFHGITGSGKTEVYYRAICLSRDLGLKSLLLVPEIALADYMEGFFRSRMGDRVAIYHSGLSLGERYDQWMRILHGDVDLVIGARSALFVPLSKLGLIIVDEEHEFAYKQEEAPRYQARDAAVVRGKMEKALVILGSGTPSIQSYHNALLNRYKLISMPERIEQRPLPRVETVDMKDLPEGETKDTILSPLLIETMNDSLRQKNQIILFLNRRGFNRVYLCRSCGEPIRCANCDLTMTYHKQDDRLLCHYCGFYSQPKHECSQCGQGLMRAYGFGTERLEEELKELFPEATVGRLDRDSTRKKGEAARILKMFSDKEIDILVGTQIIAKGYDFPDVTLVGVISADLSLEFPDFRASERTFQLLSQVAGRAGRGDQKGRVIVQTFNPGHYAITTARKHDFKTFYEQEKDLRQQLGYPPFRYLACLRLQGNNKQNTEKVTLDFGQGIKGMLSKWPTKGKDIQILGPVEAPLSKLKGKYRWQILIKTKSAELLHYFLDEMDNFSKRFLRNTGVGLVIDVDPYQML